MRPEAEACRAGEVRGLGALLGWGLPLALIALGILVQAWSLWLWIPAFLIAGITCTLNAARCGRLHCYATGPLFLAASLLLALVAADALGEGWVDVTMGGVLVGTVLAFGVELLLGRRYLRT